MRQVLKIDAAFEGAVAAVLVIGIVAGLNLPLPGGRLTIAVLAVVFAAAGVWIWRIAPTASRSLVVAIAAANAAGGVVLAGWLAVASANFSVAGAALVGATASCFAVLAAIELSLPPASR